MEEVDLWEYLILGPFLSLLLPASHKVSSFPPSDAPVTQGSKHMGSSNHGPNHLKYLCNSSPCFAKVLGHSSEKQYILSKWKRYI